MIFSLATFTAVHVVLSLVALVLFVALGTLAAIRFREPSVRPT